MQNINHVPNSLYFSFFQSAYINHFRLFKPKQIISTYFEESCNPNQYVITWLTLFKFIGRNHSL